MAWSLLSIPVRLSSSFRNSMGGDYSASPRLSFFNLIQYDNRSKNLGWQSRVRWTLQPGNELFVSFTKAGSMKRATI